MVLLSLPLLYTLLCCGQTRCHTARAESAALSQKSLISVCLKVPQLDSSIKHIRPRSNTSGFQILSTKPEALWPQASDCCSVHPHQAQKSSKRSDRLAVHQQP